MDSSKHMMAIYGLFDSRSPDEVRYVGRAGEPAVRLRSHISACKRNSTKKDKWISHVITDGGFIDAYVIEWGRVGMSRYAEAYWIKTLETIGHDLTNTYKRARPWDTVPCHSIRRMWSFTPPLPRLSNVSASYQKPQTYPL